MAKIGKPAVLQPDAKDRRRGDYHSQLTMNARTHWVLADQIEKVAPAVEAQSWLLEAGSITARLKHRWPGTRVRLVYEGRDTPYPEECLRLGLHPNSMCWVREVRLHAAEQLLVHARTVVPHWGPGNPWHDLSALGERPLGELLFQLPDLQRSPLEFGLTHPETLNGDSNGLAQGPLNQPASRPARRCTYTRDGAALLLTEAFDFLISSPARGG